MVDYIHYITRHLHARGNGVGVWACVAKKTWRPAYGCCESNQDSNGPSDNLMHALALDRALQSPCMFSSMSDERT